MTCIVFVFDLVGGLSPRHGVDKLKLVTKSSAHSASEKLWHETLWGADNVNGASGASARQVIHCGCCIRKSVVRVSHRRMLLQSCCKKYHVVALLPSRPAPPH